MALTVPKGSAAFALIPGAVKDVFKHTDEIEPVNTVLDKELIVNFEDENGYGGIQRKNRFYRVRNEKDLFEYAFIIKEKGKWGYITFLINK